MRFILLAGALFTTLVAVAWMPASADLEQPEQPRFTYLVTMRFKVKPNDGYEYRVESSTQFESSVLDVVYYGKRPFFSFFDGIEQRTTFIPVDSVLAIAVKKE